MSSSIKRGSTTADPPRPPAPPVVEARRYRPMRSATSYRSGLVPRRMTYLGLIGPMICVSGIAVMFRAGEPAASSSRWARCPSSYGSSRSASNSRSRGSSTHRSSPGHPPGDARTAGNAGDRPSLRLGRQSHTGHGAMVDRPTSGRRTRNRTGFDSSCGVTFRADWIWLEYRNGGGGNRTRVFDSSG